MREIKFRAWDKNQKLMLHFHNPSICFEYGYLALESVEYPGIANLPGMPSIKELEVMQFTGLLDKNGEEIYEGDILKADSTYPLEVYWMGLAWGIRWNDNESAQESIICDDGADMELSGRSFKHFEVIGNIWENPELLK